MSSQRYYESRTFRDDNRQSTDGYDTPYSSRITIPIQSSTNNFSRDINEQRVQERVRRQDTTVQWVNDPITGQERFRVTINIDGFSQNEVNMKVDGYKLVVYGEHIENQNQSTSKKIIEKTYELPRDIDIYNPQVSYPTPITMQIDFPSRHSNVIIDNGRLSTGLVSNYDKSYRTTPPLNQERSSTEYTSTRKLGGDRTYQSFSNPRTYSTYDELYGGPNTRLDNRYSSTSHYQSTDRQSPSREGFIGSRKEPFNNSTYTYDVTTGYPSSRITYPTGSRDESGLVQEKNFTETHHETHHRRSSPTTGVQSSHEVEHHRSGSPSIARSLDEDRFQPSVGFRNYTNSSPISSRNVEVREYSRRVGDSGNNNFTNDQSSFFTRGFNSDAFYRSAFQPQVFVDNRGQNCIEMKLDAQNYEPNEIKVSVNGSDLIVKAEHSVDRPPTSSSRAYFYKQITLPPNTDINSLSSQYRPDGKLYITAKLFNDQSSIRYN